MMTHKQFFRISDIADFITNRLVNKLENNDSEDFVRENDIIRTWSISKDYKPSQEDINEALYKINCHYKAPVIFSKNVLNHNYSNFFERAFYFETMDLNMRAKISMTIENSTKLFRTNNEQIDEDSDLCKVVMSEKQGIYLFTQLKIDTTPPFLKEIGDNSFAAFSENPNHFYVFNSMFSNFQLNSEIYLDFERFNSFKTINGNQIFYPENHFDSIELDELKSYKFN